MKILLLSPYKTDISEFLGIHGDEVITTQEKITSRSEDIKDIDFIISYGYRHIIGESLIQLFRNKIVNIHISFLPWNRGADPNLWSFLEDTKKGVSIHYIDSGIDTGGILVQEEIHFTEDDTLKTSYYKLTATASDLLKKHWHKIKKGEMVPKPQNQHGSSHRLQDRKKYEYLLDRGWDTPVKDLIGKALKF